MSVLVSLSLSHSLRYNTFITHLQTRDWQTLSASAWLTAGLTYMQPNTPISSLCSHAESYISCLVNPLWLA